MYHIALGHAFTLAMTIDYRTMAAKKALLEPGVSVRYVESAKDTYNVAFARLQVTSIDGETKEIEATPSDIELVRQNEAFPKYLDDVMIYARLKTVEFQKAEELRQKQEWDDTVAKVKGWVRKCLPF